MKNKTELELQELREKYNNQIVGATKALSDIDAEVDRRIDELKGVKLEASSSIKISSIKKQVCGFDKAWVGKCKSTNLLENGQCKEHQQFCSCGKLAVKECSHAGQFVCGRPLCESCRCNH